MDSIHDRIATAEGKRRYVRSLFQTIADRYDFITVALSYGQDRRWKRRALDLAGVRGSEHVLDLATGTGDLAFALEGRVERVVGLDLTKRMIELARAKATTKHSESSMNAKSGAKVDFLVGDMLALPFHPASFDLVTTGYGLRNVPDLDRALDEIARVLKPGGQVISLDFNRPENPLVRGAYLFYLAVVGGALGWLLHRDADTYRYIPASIRRYPGAAAVARMLEARGFTRVKYYPVLGGLMAIHHAHR